MYCQGEVFEAYSKLGTKCRLPYLEADSSGCLLW